MITWLKCLLYSAFDEVCVLDLDTLMRVFPKLGEPYAEMYLPDLVSAMQEGQITTRARSAGFLATIGEESADLTRWEENLNYSAELLLQTWPRRYTVDLAEQHAHKPKTIATYVYSFRNGNGAPGTGDGWRYRGRGPIQITGLSNYREMGQILGLDLVAKPEMLLEPGPGFRSAVAFWTSRKLNELADARDIAGMTKRVSGGLGSLSKRQKRYEHCCEVLGV